MSCEHHEKVEKMLDEISNRVETQDEDQVVDGWELYGRSRRHRKWRLMDVRRGGLGGR